MAEILSKNVWGKSKGKLGASFAALQPLLLLLSLCVLFKQLEDNISSVVNAKTCLSIIIEVIFQINIIEQNIAFNP